MYAPRFSAQRARYLADLQVEIEVEGRRKKEEGEGEDKE
jgi:hypothetical protein